MLKGPSKERLAWIIKNINDHAEPISGECEDDSHVVPKWMDDLTLDELNWLSDKDSSWYEEISNN